MAHMAQKQGVQHAGLLWPACESRTGDQRSEAAMWLMSSPAGLTVLLTAWLVLTSGILALPPPHTRVRECPKELLEEHRAK